MAARHSEASRSPLALSLRWTFIDVDDPEPPSHSAPRRAASAPPGAARRVAEDESEASIFAGERAYIAGLVEHLERQWSEAVPDGAPSPVVPADHNCNGVVSELLLRTKVELDGLRQQDAEAVTTIGDASSTGTASQREGSQEQSRTVRDEQRLALTNEGSVGHPFLCSRPCLYFAAGQCANGAACAFCHLSHTKRAAHLDKRHRDILRQLTMERAAEVLLPVLQEKVLAVDDAGLCRGAFAALACACGVPEVSPVFRPSRSERTLIAGLTSLGLKCVMSTLRRTIVDNESVAVAADELLRQLRYAAPQSDELSP